VRSYVGWYRHITLVLLAAAFLLGITVQSHLTASAPPAEPAAGAPLIPLTPSETRHPAFPPLLARSHRRAADLSVVDLSACPSVLGRLLPSSPPRQSQLTLCVESPGLPRTSSGSFPGTSPGKLPESCFGNNSWELSRECVRMALVLVVCLTRKEVPYDVCVGGPGVSSPGH
jgi:hypothetical protein